MKRGCFNFLSRDANILGRLRTKYFNIISEDRLRKRFQKIIFKTVCVLMADARHLAAVEPLEVTLVFTV